MQHTGSKDFVLRMREECIGNRISRLHRVIARHFDQALRPLGLSLPQLEVLAVLEVRGSVTPSTIAGALAIERSTISRNLTVMERNGWISTEAGASGRTRSVSITATGSELFASAETAWTKAQLQVTEKLGSDAASTLDTWLENLTD